MQTFDNKWWLSSHINTNNNEIASFVKYTTVSKQKFFLKDFQTTQENFWEERDNSGKHGCIVTIF